MRINYNIEYELTEEEATQIKTLLEFEDKEVTTVNIEKLLKNFIEYYCGTDLLKQSTITEKRGIEGLLEEALNIEYNVESFHRGITEK